ncbi:MAG TPA: HAD family phosphatase [Verrucomicrobiae bacterium]|nr:HAD family phosphatase [Verrucomicrobiae bacterium]
MAPPEAVIFDLGKVLVDFDYSIAAHRIAARARMTAPDIQASIDHSPLLFRFETGRMSREEFFAEVRSTTGFDGTLQEFTESFADIFTPIEPMVRLHSELRRAGIPTFIFSNTNELAVGHIRSRFPFFGDFDGYILSYEHGSMKPDDALYDVVEATTGRRGASLLYFDDRLENVKTASGRGWRAVHHISPDESRKAAQQAGLLK